MSNLLEKLRTKDDDQMDQQIESKSNTNQTQIGELFAQDPEPNPEINSETISAGKQRGRPKGVPNRTTGRPPGRPSNLQKQVTEEISMYSELLATVWEMRDPVCGGAAVKAAPAASAAIARILSRYPQVMARLSATGQLADWIALLTALAPVGKAVWSHHIATAEEEVSNDDDTLGGGYADRYPAFTGIPRTGPVG